MSSLNCVAGMTLCAAALVAVPLRAEEKPKPLIFCAEPTAMPRTGKTADDTAQGLDVALAKLLCKKLGRPFEVHWCSSPACSRKCLREGRCDVILGHPHDDGAPQDIAWSVPYAGSMFRLVVARGNKDVRSLADLTGKRIGIVAGTVALPENKQTVVRFQTREEVLDRFAADKLDAAFVDGDFAAWHLHSHPKLNLRLVEYVPRERWNMALAARAKSAQLLVQINKALTELIESGELQKAYEGLGVVYRAPFTGNARRPAPVDAWKRILERGEIRVALDPDNLPYSMAKGERSGFDVELARALAEAIGLKLRTDWLDVQRETSIGKLLENESDLALGAAVEPNAVEDDEELADKVIYSRPYYGTGYVLVTRKNGPKVKGLAELKGAKARRLGTEAGSIADYRLRQRGYLRALYRNQQAALKALTDGDIDYAYLWANVGWTLHAAPDLKLELTAGYVPEDHWNIAVAMRKPDAELKRRVDAALEKLLKDGAVARMMARYHVPHWPPFEEKKSGAVDEVIRHPVADRGIEPRLQKVETSRNPYGGLERVRSAGVLVVGLDQNNLPFSTAHPAPAGLDYEIAGLLAKKLGVSLKVYWGYSSHDSYPSKLATKKLCDVMLGVMPDDRFGDRVLFSRPYYTARYQLVVPVGGSVEEPLAVEPGVAARGIQGRQTKTYASLEDILAAVASRKVKAGYVISTRGSWLAEQRWPGKLQFLDGAAEDRFPICAAVRKSDKDLNDAINQSLDELTEAGHLVTVFDRWRIPRTVQRRGGSAQP